MVAVVTTACIQERQGAKLIFQALTGSCKKIRRIWVDGGYRGSPLVEWGAKRFHIIVENVLHCDDTKGFKLLLNVRLLNDFAWLYRYRRLSKDYEVLTESSTVFIHIVMINLMLARL
jgi:putative transposase